MVQNGVVLTELNRTDKWFSLYVYTCCGRRHVVEEDSCFLEAKFPPLAQILQWFLQKQLHPQYERHKRAIEEGKAPAR